VFRPPVSPSGAAPSGAAPGASPASEKANDLPRRPSAIPWPLPGRGGDGAPSSVSPTTGTAVPLPAAGLQRPAAPGPSAASPGPDREEVVALVARGQTYLASGDVVSARLVFRRAAEAGDAPAALALGGTYDPFVLRSLGVIGVVADAAQARTWYQKAAELGSREAPRRIDQLAQRTR
jgi:TPR repeat protein